MIFLSEKTRHVWDSRKNNILCTFQDGKYETEDDYTIKRLLDLGYMTENGSEIVINDANEVVIEDAPETDAIDVNNMSIRKLRDYCKKRGYKGYHNLDVESLRAFVKERE